MKLLVVEDDRMLSALIRRALTEDDFSVDLVADAEQAEAVVSSNDYDGIILDLILPGKSGLQFLQHFRREGRLTPILILTGRRAKQDIVRGLDVGADDYLTKPFSPQELVLRVGAILRRIASSADLPDIITAGPIKVDRSAHRVTVNNHEVELTPTEFKLLLTLAERRGRVQARSHLLETVWDAAPDIQTRTVDMHVQRLRTKLHPAGDLIETVRGFGYRLKMSAKEA